MRAGGPVEITFENVDVMPHNVVVTRPGALEEVGRAADAEAERNPAGAEASGYVPKTPLVLFRTGLVQPGRNGGPELQRPEGTWPLSLRLHLPRTLDPDEGHDARGRAARRRGGHPLRRPPARPGRSNSAPSSPTGSTRCWRPTSLPWMPCRRQAPRELERGRLLFLEAGCATCHQLGGAGGEIGPALDDVGERRPRRSRLSGNRGDQENLSSIASEGPPSSRGDTS